MFSTLLVSFQSKDISKNGISMWKPISSQGQSTNDVYNQDLYLEMQTVLSGGNDYQMAWMLIYNTDFLDARAMSQQQQVLEIIKNTESTTVNGFCRNNRIMSSRGVRTSLLIVVYRKNVEIELRTPID
jgi:hypothetical protein